MIIFLRVCKSNWKISLFVYKIYILTMGVTFFGVGEWKMPILSSAQRRNFIIFSFLDNRFYSATAL